MRTNVMALTITVILAIYATTGCDNEVPPPEPAANYCRYMPTDVGNWWEYKVTVESMFSPREEYKLTMEINETKNSYEGIPTAYVITVTREGKPSEDIIAAPLEETCYLERVGWAYLVADDMEVGEWSQTGFVDDYPLQYVRDVQVTIPPPAGKTEKVKTTARELYRDVGNEFKPEKWVERYAEGVGLVYYENNFKQYRIDPFELIDWRTVKYELTAYSVKKR